MGNLLGVVLCGGQSTRMGRDKGLISFDGTPWAGLVAAKLQAMGLPVVVSVNPSQVESYRSLFPGSQLVVDTAPAEGPLKGLLSVHQQYPTHYLLLVACDMIDMAEATLQHLLSQAQQRPGFDFYVYEKDSFAEPFGGIYTAAGLRKVAGKVMAKELVRFSLRGILDSSHTLKVPLDNLASFKNYNTPQALT